MATRLPAVCECCGKDFTYDPAVSKGRFCSRDCRYKCHSQIIKESYTDELRAERSAAATKQMQDPEQIKVRQEKCNGGEFTPERIAQMSEATKKQMEDPMARENLRQKHMDGPNYRKTAIDAYGCKCQRCGKDMSDDLGELVVHHKDRDNYLPELTDNSPENLMVLCKSCHTKLHLEMRNCADRFTGQYHFELAALEILKGLKQMGFVPDYENFHSTPKRFARAYFEIFEGCQDTEQKIQNILSTSFPAEENTGMVVAKDIVCFSMCPHHLLPVEYHVCVAYIPNKDGRVLGISKLARLVEVLAKRPALQEAFTQEIVDHLAAIGIYGAAALVEGQHMCMRMRGVKSTNSTITTTAVSGVFADDNSTKQEFLDLIKDRLKFRA